ncbi:DUF5994 family protein [Streptomyces griseorubiginosus]|uniref:DUF5994 family protein n=1 Tax=Streptomyces griseorubiginosus TaxID=67304 RepID=UPI0036E75644
MEPTADHSATTAKRTSPPAQVRLSLAPYEIVSGRLDGAWWPYSNDLVVELPLLVEAMAGAGSFTRVTLGIELWPDVPHEVGVGEKLVTVGWFASGHEQNEILLCSYLKGFRTLLVIPPTTEADAAAWLMNTPAPVDGRNTATELLAIAKARFTAPEVCGG